MFFQKYCRFDKFLKASLQFTTIDVIGIRIIEYFSLPRPVSVKTNRFCAFSLLR